MRRPGCPLLCALLLIAGRAGESADAQAPPAAERASIATAAELLDLFGMDESFFNKFRDGELWDGTQDDPLARALVRLAQIKRVDLERWTIRDVKARDVADDPRKFAGKVLLLEGTVRRVTRVKASIEQQERYDLQKYYRCELVLGNNGSTAVVFAGNVPAKWSLDAPISQRASARAMFLKRGPADESAERTLYFAADRVAWHPGTLLGKMGMDYGLFDNVRHDRAISDSERECFYQLLAAAGRSPAEAMDAVNDANATARLVRLTAEPDAHEGELYSFRGVARRAVKIHVSDADTVARFGFDHYFELVVFVDLDGYANIAGKKVNNHPVVFCLRELPAGMPTGENIVEMVRASGFMFKKWRYTTQLAGDNGAGVLVASPLLIGHTAVWQRGELAQRRFDPRIGGAVVAALMCLGFFVWWYSRRERRIHNAVLAGRRTIPDRVSLDDLESDSMDIATEVDRD
jgi:hypothetical protein